MKVASVPAMPSPPSAGWMLAHSCVAPARAARFRVASARALPDWGAEEEAARDAATVCGACVLAHRAASSGRWRAPAGRGARR
eukprot:7387213-Prymnesium_polylepis.1